MSARGRFHLRLQLRRAMQFWSGRNISQNGTKCEVAKSSEAAIRMGLGFQVGVPCQLLSMQVWTEAGA